MTARNATQGSKWIRREKRLAIYMRDGMACCYCGEGIEDGAELSLDHLRCNARGGSNHETNLVTACKRCNTARGTRPVRTFCHAVAEYLGRTDGQTIERYVRNSSRRALDVAAAKALIAKRGSWAAALKGETV